VNSIVRSLRRSVFLTAIFCAVVSPLCVRAEEAAPKPFDAKSLAAIQQASQGKPFVLAFWSLHCAPCKTEMPILKQLQEKYPTLRIVLVATDESDEHPAVAKFIAKQQLGKVESWAFDDEFSERVRYAVDRTWRGELPRTYLFDASHKPTVHTGPLEMEMVESWLARAQTPSH
jgi:thiol-disulfide isomerase/thioredoxin